jgi:hypothetical protein
MARATAQKPHWITIALSIIAILLSAVSLYQSCAVQKLSRATARAMVIFGAAELTGFNVSQKVGEQMRTTSLTFNVQVQNVGKAMAHNVTLHYQAHLLPLRQAEISENGQILFGDDPLGMPALELSRQPKVSRIGPDSRRVADFSRVEQSAITF